MTRAPDERDAAAVRIFPPAIPLSTIAVGELLDYLWPLAVAVTLQAPLRYWLGGALIVAAVLGLGLWSVLLVRGSGQSENPWQPTSQIIRRGPFRISRNPMYLQMVLVCIGAAVASWNPWTLILTLVCAWLLQRLAIEPEETYLARKFGDEYLAYQREVRRWL